MARERRSELHMQLAQVRAQIADLDGSAACGSGSEESASSAGARLVAAEFEVACLHAGQPAHGWSLTPGGQAVHC